MATLHDVAGSVFRHLPPFQGKARIGAALGGILHRNGSDGDSIVTVQMRDGSRMRLDIRSRDDLKRAVEAGLLRTIRGFGPKMEERLLAAVTAAVNRMPRTTASAHAAMPWNPSCGSTSSGLAPS